MDGNGRTGRILIPIYLLSKGIINKPCFYISDYIEKNKEAYYNFLSRVRTNNDMISWIKFFLEATIETEKTENLKKVIEVLYNEPTVNRNYLIQKTGIKSSTIKNIVNILLNNDVIAEKAGYSRNKFFNFDKYIELYK